MPEGPIQVIVRAGAVTGARFLDTGAALDAQRLATLPSISGLFALVDAAYAQSAATVEFTANAGYGYLESLFIDYSLQVADKALCLDGTNFIADPA